MQDGGGKPIFKRKKLIIATTAKNVKNKAKALLRPEMWVKSAEDGRYRISDIGYRISDIGYQISFDI